MLSRSKKDAHVTDHHKTEPLKNRCHSELHHIHNSIISWRSIQLLILLKKGASISSESRLLQCLESYGRNFSIKLIIIQTDILRWIDSWTTCVSTKGWYTFEITFDNRYHWSYQWPIQMKNSFINSRFKKNIGYLPNLLFKKYLLYCYFCQIRIRYSDSPNTQCKVAHMTSNCCGISAIFCSKVAWHFDPMLR